MSSGTPQYCPLTIATTLARLGVAVSGGSDSLVSPLAPTNGQTAISVGGRYKVTEKIDISGGVRYTWLGDALPETGTPDTPRGNFQDNNAVSVGLKVRVALN